MNRGSTRLDTWLSRLLWALAQKSGGELRLSTLDLEDVPNRCAVMTDYVRETHEVVIRAGTGAAEMIIINTEEQWTHREAIPEQRSSNSSSTEPTEPRRPRPRGVVLDDDEMAAIERRLIERAAQRTRRRQEQDLTEVYQGQNQ